jgi:DNA-binding Lrp family transcriptional regulator
VAEATEGTVELAVQYSPRPEYGLVRPRLDSADGDALDAVVVTGGGADRLWLSGPAPDLLADGRAHWRILLHRGGRVGFALGHSLQGDPAPEPWPQEEIGRWLTVHPDARLVIVDVFARIRGRSGPQSSAYANDYGPMSVLKALADKHGVAILVVHHTRKADAEDFLDVISGTQGLAGAADCIVVLKRSRGTADGVLHVTGRDVEEAEYALTFSPELGAWQMLDGPAADYSLGDTRQRILRYVREHAAATPKQVADALGINYETAKKTCRRMSDDGQLDTDGSGTYFPPPVPVPPVPAVPEDAQEVFPHTHPVPLSDLEGQQGHEGQGTADPECPPDGRHHVVQRLVDKRGWDEQHAVTTVDAAYSRLRKFRSPSEMFDRIDNNPERYRPATS